jgi:DNA-binding SARP family transcriptional activator
MKKNKRKVIFFLLLSDNGDICRAGVVSAVWEPMDEWDVMLI